MASDAAGTWWREPRQAALVDRSCGAGLSCCISSGLDSRLLHTYFRAEILSGDDGRLTVCWPCYLRACPPGAGFWFFGAGAMEQRWSASCEPEGGPFTVSHEPILIIIGPRSWPTQA